MSKASTAIYALLAVACGVLLFVWYATGLYLVDDPLDLIVAIAWWAVIGVAVYLTVRADNTRKERVRTVYVGEAGAMPAVFNPEKGLVEMDGRTAQDTTYALLKDLDYGFGRKDFPDEEEFTPEYMVRTREFKADGDDTTWKGEVVKPDGDQALRWQFDDPQQLQQILATI
ncbi:hypothetical protein QJ043_03555 [Olsenella sp. YH-ols2217]|uniref:DUF2207 domain-containing protein n=1 Tax=Kribbibacterium absianum TaxID=3044210 RepID=A0ABT6ZKI1_9ACTN|nr:MULTISPECIES: hypothetical protein [unclassified Olsenella]MDJ1122723.1 hypothetical protein [Olsenella sp. YH-ols2216]MDJ1129161.1 hypothetical protein [Olsenella sp. YH-ols2217]